MSAKFKYSTDKYTLFVGFISGFIFIGFLDPINWPKQIALATLTPIIVYAALSKHSRLSRKEIYQGSSKFFILSIILIVISAILSALLKEVNLTRTLWGIWGRNNGLITALCLWLIALSFYWFAKKKTYVSSFLHSVEIVAIVFSFYGLIQYFGIDPVNWSQANQIFSFFGNTNFAAAVLSLCASTFLVLAVLELNQTLALRVVRLMLFLVTTFLTFKTDSIQGLSALLIVLVLVVFIKLNFVSNSHKYLYLTVSGLSGIVVFLGTLGIGPLGSYIGQYTVQLRYQYWLAGLKIGASSPIYGVGMDSYGDYFRTYRTQEVAERTSIDLVTNNAHNVFIQAFATMGILGLLAVLIPFLGALYYSGKILLSNDFTQIQKAVVAIFLSLWSMAFFSIDNISIAVWNYVFLGLVWGIQESGAEHLESSQKLKNQRQVIEVEPIKYLVFALSALIFGITWYASFPERSLQRYLSTPVNSQDSIKVSERTLEIRSLSNHPFVQETEFWYLASELNKINNSKELFEVLEIANSEFMRDFNLLDLSAGYREQRNLQADAIPFREGQLIIEKRHPRVWLSYAYDLLAAGRKQEAQEAFNLVKANSVFLDSALEDQLEAIAKDFGL
jgi:O-antigen ligase